MRQVPSESGFRANTTHVTCPTVECWNQPRSTSCVRCSASPRSDSRFTGRDRGIGALPVSMTSYMPRSGGSPGAARKLESREGRIIRTCQTQLRIRHPKPPELQLGAVAEDLEPVDETVAEGRPGTAHVTAIPGRLPLRRLEGGEFGVVRLHRARPLL